ncbi:MAG: AAA family ATPase [Candidatus Micrarchaeota archaeon]|nr:AAA family ATPase [Candidatus Micrarchaeota archaeon]
MQLLDFKPKALKEFIGNKEAVYKISLELRNYLAGKGKHVLAYGKNGVGKTLLAELLANEYNMSLCRIENVTNKEELAKTLKNYDYNTNLFNQKILILIDDVSNILNVDNEVPKLLKDFLKKTNAFVYMTADDIYENRHFNELRELSLCVEFKRVSTNEIESFLKTINEKHNLGFNKDDLEKIAINANGDIRAALNDLLACNCESQRDFEKNIFEFLIIVFKTKDIETIKTHLNALDMDISAIKFWILENIVNEYESLDEISSVLNYLSKSDIFDRRIIKRQAWKLLKYSIDLAVVGTALSKKHTYKKQSRFKFPTTFAVIRKINELRNKKRSISDKIAIKHHCSVKEVEKNFYVYRFFATYHKNKFSKFYDLDDKDIDFMQLKSLKVK